MKLFQHCTKDNRKIFIFKTAAMFLRWRQKKHARTFQAVEKAFTDKQWEVAFTILEKFICRRSEKVPEYFMYMAIQNNAPECIVWLLMQINPTRFTSYMDRETRQYPVHLLAKKASKSSHQSYSLDLFCEVASLYSNALTWPDKNGCTPLHLYLLENKGDYDTIAFICDLAPSVTVMEDRDGNTPMEHAIISDDPPPSAVLDLLHARTSESERLRDSQCERYRLTKRRVSYTGSTFSGSSFNEVEDASIGIINVHESNVLRSKERRQNASSESISISVIESSFPSAIDLSHADDDELKRYQDVRSKRYRSIKRRASYSGSTFSDTSQTISTTSEYEKRGRRFSLSSHSAFSQ